jgi:predicted nucleic acid-binding protein
VARIIILDSGPLGDSCRKRGHPDVELLRGWLVQAYANGALIAIPEIADYEVRRGLLCNGATEGIERLDQLRKELKHYIPITTAAMRKAAELWADARRKGLATADDKGIDADVILASQALFYAGLDDELIVAIYNTRHLARYLDARHWSNIAP